MFNPCYYTSSSLSHLVSYLSQWLRFQPMEMKHNRLLQPKMSCASIRVFQHRDYYLNTSSKFYRTLLEVLTTAKLRQVYLLQAILA